MDRIQEQMKHSGKSFHLLTLSPRGDPMPRGELADAFLLDLEFMPPFQHRSEVTAGKVTLPVPDEPFAICMPLPVEGFGHVYVYADNQGAGYKPAEVAGRTLNFLLEAADARAAAVGAAEGRFADTGTEPSSDYRERMSSAQTILEDARRRRADDVVCTQLATRSLAASMHAGELLVLEHARARIAASGRRQGFRFGCNAFRYPGMRDPYAAAFRGLFNFATLPFYRSQTEAEEGVRDFSKAEQILEWAAREGLEVKGHPLVWFHRGGVPDWLRGRSYEEVSATHRDYISDAVGRFRDPIKVWDVINEAHDWANDLSYGADQLTEMTRLAAQATREADPEAVRIVNCTETWGQYVASGRGYAGEIGHPARTALRYLRDIMEAGVDFEVIGLQMYSPQRDLFEIDRQLDRYGRLGKPMHITELGVPSATHFPQDHDNREALEKIMGRRWHGHPWSESEQADWVEGYYTLCYSKSTIEAITWWDLCDPAFIPHSGLLDGALREKEAYRRLATLLRSWR
jgi:GH35 family endo-1,4-beta-xylanase/nucleotide-binding universal stress UspA family protein